MSSSIISSNGNPRRIVVTGMGAITPLGHTLKQSWNNLIKGNHGFTSLETALKQQGLSDDTLQHELELSRRLPCQVAAPIVGGITDDHNNNRTGRFVQLALIASKEAMKQANLYSWLQVSESDNNDAENNGNSVDTSIQGRRKRIGVCVGSGMSCVREVVESSMIATNKSLKRVSPYFIPKVLANSAAGQISLAYKTYGPNHTVSTACATGGHSIGDAYNFIKMGYSDIMIAGGTESCIDPWSLNGFCRLRALSTKYNDSPESSSRPFDTERDGFVMGEGSCILILEELNHALQRIADSDNNGNNSTRILGEIVGYGLSSDSYHITSPDPNGYGAKQAMKMALQMACRTTDSIGDNYGKNIVDEVGYVNAHATSTPIGDEIEANVINDTFFADDESDTSSTKNNRQFPLYVSSTKGSTGHLLGASGSIEAAFTLMTLDKQIIPPTRNLCNPCSDTNMNFHHVVTTTRKTVDSTNNNNDLFELAVSNSFGFGGTNTSLVFKRYSS